jgi:5-methylcytosine-specific restriction protein B
MDNKNFDWIKFYTEFAIKLIPFDKDRILLLIKLKKVLDEAKVNFPIMENDHTELRDICPFTVFSIFNRGITNENRRKICAGLKSEFQIEAPVPESFDGIPVLDNRKSWFFAYKDKRRVDDIDNLWNLFARAIEYDDNHKRKGDFIEAFNRVLLQSGIKWNITMGLYWIAPFSFLNLDSVNQNFIVNNSEIVNNIEVDGLFKKMINGNEYLQLIKSCEDYFKKEKSKYRSFPELSLAAWKYSQNKVNKCWLVGASWGRVNKTDEFIENEIWQNGYDDKYLDEVKHVKVGDKIVIKTTYTMKNNLPFEYNRSASVMDIVAIGTVTKNLKDGKNLKVNWNNKLDEPKKWYFGSWRDTIQEIKRDKSWKEADLLDFIFEGKEQNYNKFLNDKTDEESELSDKIGQEVMELDKNNINPYTKQNFLNEVFMKETDYDKLVALLKHKKNIILQGAPGVGKTFTAKRLAYSLISAEDDSRIEMVQFHQNYSYEDFVMGYRPTETGFELRNGVFYDFCEKARCDIENDYYFIIDEINRGNLSAVFGELLMLVESDYRDKPVRLVYKKDKLFSVPHNVYIIGMMNTADRSIAMIDYALRRRFSFFTMKPGFESNGFMVWQHKVSNDVFDTLIEKIKKLNADIAADDSLGEGFCIGHSYFVYDEKNIPANGVEAWLRNVVYYDICPMLDEYWFDDKQKSEHWQNELTGIFSK